MTAGDAEEPTTSPPKPPVPARPTAPRLSGQRRSGLRPARPGKSSASSGELEVPEIEPPPEPEPAIAETIVIATPSEPMAVATPRRRPQVRPGSAAFQKTLLPPCVTLAVGCLFLGLAYFFQPADSAIRQFSPGIAIALIAIGAACGMTAALLWRTLRQID